MPHLRELRDTMTWIGVTLLPLGLVVSAGRAYPRADAPTATARPRCSARAITAGVGLLIYDWAWGVVTELSRLLTAGLLGLPWVADGVERMLETLVIGGATGSAVAAEFVVPLMIMVAGDGAARRCCWCASGWRSRPRCSTCSAGWCSACR